MRKTKPALDLASAAPHADSRALPAYPIPETARHLRIPGETLRSWCWAAILKLRCYNSRNGTPEDATMTTSVTAVFEAGLLRPTVPLELAEGSRVELIVISAEANGKPAGRVAADILAGIAALPTVGGDPRTSQDHDQVLYGEKGAR